MTGLPGATPKTTEGPYYLSFDQSLLRSDIAEDRKGVPLTLRYTVVDAVTQAPVKGARVDTWHCDAFGYYSGYLSRDPDHFPGSEALSHIEPSDESWFLRGSQYTDQSGDVEFGTIYPGWYHNRDVHIHMKVYVDDREVYVGQLHMPTMSTTPSGRCRPTTSTSPSNASRTTKTSSIRATTARTSSRTCGRCRRAIRKSASSRRSRWQS